MTDFLDTAVKDIEERLQELKGEVTKLEQARAALLGVRRGPGRPRGASNSTARRRSGRRASRPRGRRSGGTRGNQALELVRSSPGITIPQIAEQLKIAPNYLYRVMPKLEESGQVTRSGQGWHPTSGPE